MGFLCFILNHRWDYGSTQVEMESILGCYTFAKTRVCRRCKKYQYKNGLSNKWITKQPTNKGL